MRRQIQYQPLMTFASIMVALCLPAAATTPTANLDQQLACICLSQVTCDLTRPQSFIFSHRSDGGFGNYFISPDRPARILKISNPSAATGSLESLGWVNLGSRELPKVWVLHFNPNGQIRHHNLTEQKPWEDDSGLKNWLETKRLEEVLHHNGIPLEKKRFDMGTWLLRQSDAVGLLPAEGLRKSDGSLTEVIKRYHDESLYPSREQAYEFQLKYRDLFKDCNPKDGLCDIHGWTELTALETQEPVAIEVWKEFYQNRLKANLQSQPTKNLPPQCLNGVEIEFESVDSQLRTIQRRSTQ